MWINGLSAFDKDMEKIKRKKTQKEFASFKKVSTFAAPFGNGGIEKLFYNIGFQIFLQKNLQIPEK